MSVDFFGLPLLIDRPFCLFCKDKGLKIYFLEFKEVKEIINKEKEVI